MAEKIVHEGRNVKRIRDLMGITQDSLALELGLSQQAMSSLEQKAVLDSKILEDVAKALKVPVDAIKRFNEETAIAYFNTFNDSSKGEFNYQCTFNPLDKFVEQVDKNEILYDALLKSEREKNELLVKMLEKK